MPFATALCLLVLRLFKFSGIDLFLVDLRAFAASKPDGSATITDPKTRKERKQAAKQVQLKGQTDQSLCLYPLKSSYIKSLTFGSEFNDLVQAVVLVVANVLLASMVAWFGGGNSPSVSIISALVFGFATYTTLKVDLGSLETNSLWEKLHLLVIAALGAAVSCYLLCPWPPGHPLAPGRFLVGDFGAKGARELVDKVTTLWMERLEPLLGPDRGWHRTQQGVLLLVGLSLWAGYMAAALYGPAVRYASLLYSMSCIPPWAAVYLKPRRWALWVGRIGFLAPLLAVALQLRPATQLWGIPDAWQPHLLAGCLLVTALTHCMALRSMCQAWLGSGLTDWYKYRHNGVESERKAEALKRMLTFIRTVLSRTAVQVFGLAAIAATTAVLVGLHGPHGLLATLSQPAMRQAPLALGQALRQAAGGWVAGGAAATRGPALEDPTLGRELLETAAVQELGLGLEGMAGSEAADTVAGVVPAAAAAAASIDFTPLFVFLGQFYGWWACLVWGVTAVATLTVERMKLNVG